MVLIGAGVGWFPEVHAAFVATTTNSGNSISAAAAFPDYPTVVQGDSPLFYHRLDDTAGSTTAADSSGHGLTGVNGTANTAAKLLLPFDEGSGTAAADLAGQTTANNATLTNATWAAGHSGSAAAFDGTGDYVATASTGVDTSTYLTVSAWVYLSSKAANMTAVSQVSTGNSAFRLEYRTGGTDRFAFSMTQSNTAGATVDRITFGGSPSLSTWYHLVGSYESNGNIYLYIDGVESSGVAHTTTWNATGAVEVGSAKVNNVRGEWWNGRVDEVRLYPTFLTMTPVKELLNSQSAGPSSSWGFEENSGATTADLSGNPNTGTLPGRWEFLMSQAESYGPTLDYAAATAAVPTSTWVHLTGVYDTVAAQLRLYVNGAADGTTAHTTTWNATSTNLQVGRQREYGGWINPWQGRIDDARTWRRALTAAEIARLYNSAAINPPTFGHIALSMPGALQGAQQGQQSSSSAAFSGNGNGYNPTRYTNPTTFSLECWFKTIRAGGKLISFGNVANGNSATYDRILSVNASGNVVFGAGSGTSSIIQSPSTYLDGAWHYVVATVSPTNKMVLYVDGVSVGTQATYSLGNYTGVWRWGGETSNATWPAPGYFIGQIDEVAGH